MGCWLAFVLTLLDPGPSPAAAAAVAREVADLASPRFAVREAAGRALAGRGAAVKRVLRRAAAEAADAEVRTRAAAVLGRILAAELEWLRPVPEIDTQWYDVDQKTYRAAPPELEAYLDARGTDKAPWPNYFLAMEDLVRDRLAAGAPAKLLRWQLAELHGRDAVFFSTAASRPLPPSVDPAAYWAAGFPKEDR